MLLLLCAAVCHVNDQGAPPACLHLQRHLLALHNSLAMATTHASCPPCPACFPWHAAVARTQSTAISGPGGAIATGSSEASGESWRPSSGCGAVCCPAGLTLDDSWQLHARCHSPASCRSHQQRPPRPDTASARRHHPAGRRHRPHWQLCHQHRRPDRQRHRLATASGTGISVVAGGLPAASSETQTPCCQAC